MGIWLEVLNLAAAGDVPGALERLHLDLPLALRRFSEDSRGGRVYAGPVASAVTIYCSKQPPDEQRRIASHREELIDAIVDDVLAAVERSVRLVELCAGSPETTLDDLAARFPWAPGLKRDGGWKRRWIADMLRSMLAERVRLPASVVELLGGAGEACYGFDEVAFAASPERIRLSWSDFKRDQEIDRGYLCLVESEEDASVGSEAMDFRSIRLSAASRAVWVEPDLALTIDLHRAGEALGRELAAILERMHGERPGDGYRPVAWHNVFWTVGEEFEFLEMALVVHDPYLEKDGELAEHIRGAYPEVKSCSRSVVLRRRQALYGACAERIHERLLEVAG